MNTSNKALELKKRIDDLMTKATEKGKVVRVDIEEGDEPYRLLSAEVSGTRSVTLIYADSEGDDYETEIEPGDVRAVGNSITGRDMDGEGVRLSVASF